MFLLGRRFFRWRFSGGSTRTGGALSIRLSRLGGRRGGTRRGCRWGGGASGGRGGVMRAANRDNAGAEFNTNGHVVLRGEAAFTETDG